MLSGARIAQVWYQPQCEGAHRSEVPRDGALAVAAGAPELDGVVGGTDCAGVVLARCPALIQTSNAAMNVETTAHLKLKKGMRHKRFVNADM